MSCSGWRSVAGAILDAASCRQLARVQAAARSRQRCGERAQLVPGLRASLAAGGQSRPVPAGRGSARRPPRAAAICSRPCLEDAAQVAGAFVELVALQHVENGGALTRPAERGSTCVVKNRIPAAGRLFTSGAGRVRRLADASTRVKTQVLTSWTTPSRLSVYQVPAAQPGLVIEDQQHSASRTCPARRRSSWGGGPARCCWSLSTFGLTMAVARWAAHCASIRSNRSPALRRQSARHRRWRRNQGGSGQGGRRRACWLGLADSLSARAGRWRRGGCSGHAVPGPGEPDDTPVRRCTSLAIRMAASFDSAPWLQQHLLQRLAVPATARQVHDGAHAAEQVVQLGRLPREGGDDLRRERRNRAHLAERVEDLAAVREQETPGRRCSMISRVNAPRRDSGSAAWSASAQKDAAHGQRGGGRSGHGFMVRPAQPTLHPPSDLACPAPDWRTRAGRAPTRQARPAASAQLGLHLAAQGPGAWLTERVDALILPAAQQAARRPAAPGQRPGAGSFRSTTPRRRRPRAGTPSPELEQDQLFSRSPSGQLADPPRRPPRIVRLRGPSMALTACPTTAHCSCPTLSPTPARRAQPHQPPRTRSLIHMTPAHGLTSACGEYRVRHAAQGAAGCSWGSPRMCASGPAIPAACA